MSNLALKITMQKVKRVRVGISVGDLSGIGLEVIIKSFLDNRVFQTFTPIVYASKQVAIDYRKSLGIEDFSFNYINKAEDAQPKKANLVGISKDQVKLSLGQPTKLSGKFAFKSLQRAVEDLASGKIDVLVTAPIDKKNIHSEEFQFPGHTEYLAKMANTEDVLMFMVSDTIRVGVVTGHIPLNEVAKKITKADIIRKLEVMNDSLIKDFAILKPRIAVLGLNPHAGDEGLLGEEEKSIIKPAIMDARNKGIMSFGPFSADGFFGSSSFRHYDGILAMYHDQGLIPFKAMTFESGINFTAGLPVVRTSPDHGTAYDIAGKNEASPSSFRAACYMAVDIFNNRRSIKDLGSNTLTTRDQKKDEAEVV